MLAWDSGLCSCRCGHAFRHFTAVCVLLVISAMSTLGACAGRGGECWHGTVGTALAGVAMPSGILPPCVCYWSDGRCPHWAHARVVEVNAGMGQWALLLQVWPCLPAFYCRVCVTGHIGDVHTGRMRGSWR